MINILESLESRQFLSSSVNVNGVLRIFGDNDADNIVVRRVNAKIVVTQNGANSVFAASSIIRIFIDPGAGADRVTLRTSLPARVDAGGGNDFVLGGSANDTLKGEDGDDTLRGGLGDDSLRGQDGEDSLIGDAGNDSVHGGDDEDTLHGNAGDDFIDAQDRLWEDFINGGGGFDEAEIDDRVLVEDNDRNVEDVHD